MRIAKNVRRGEPENGPAAGVEGVDAAEVALELLDARAPQRGLWRWLLPWLFVVSHATVFEIVEAAAAGVFGGDLGEAYLGTQGDVWDSQKDSALAAVGALLAVVFCRWRERRGRSRRAAPRAPATPSVRLRANA